MEGNIFELINVINTFMPEFYRHINPIFNNESSENYNLSENQIKTIMCINYFEQVTPKDISAAINVKKGSLTAITKSLFNLMLVEKHKGVDDDRSYQLKLTDKGKAFVFYKQSKNTSELTCLLKGMDPLLLKKATVGLRELSHYLTSQEKKSSEV